MTRMELTGVIHQIIQRAVMDSGGDWRQGYRPYVDEIFIVMGKLTPEPKEKPTVPLYDESRVQRVRKLDFTDEQRMAARAVLRELGLI